MAKQQELADKQENTPSAVSVADTQDDEQTTLGSKVATAALIGLGAALIEVELVPGILIGAAAVLAPNMFPKLGKAMRPLVKQTIKAGYALAAKAKERAAEAGEQLQDIVAEAKAEAEHDGAATPAPAAAHEPA